MRTGPTARSARVTTSDCQTVESFAGPGTSKLTTAQCQSATFLTTCRTTAERRQRALELVAAQAMASEAYLFTRASDDEPVLLCQMGATARERSNQSAK